MLLAPNSHVTLQIDDNCHLHETTVEQRCTCLTCEFSVNFRDEQTSDVSDASFQD